MPSSLTSLSNTFSPLLFPLHSTSPHHQHRHSTYLLSLTTTTKSQCRNRSLLLLLCPGARRSRNIQFSVNKRFLETTKGEKEEDEEEGEEEGYEDEDDDDDVAAAEYQSGLSEEDADEEEGDGGLRGHVQVETSSGFEKNKWERVARVLADVREYGDGIIDY